MSIVLDPVTRAIQIQCDGCKYNFKQGNVTEDSLGFFCKKCMDKYYEACTRCQRTTHIVNTTTINGESICQACINNNYHECVKCLEYVHDDVVVWEGDEDDSRAYCHRCYEAREHDGTIHDYSFTPTLHFRKELYEAPYYMGVELEINTLIDPNVHCKLFKQYLKTVGADKQFYFKRDSSISTGYEIITHPFASSYGHKNINWKEILKWLRENKALSYEYGECGLHVHVGRGSLTNLTIGKLKMFMWTNYQAIERFSKRQNFRHCQHEEFTLLTLTHFLKGQWSQYDRHTALNIGNNKGTIEFRIFRGTLYYKRFMASLQFVNAVIDFCQEHGAVMIAHKKCWGVFRDWLRKSGKYQVLQRYLDKEKI